MVMDKASPADKNESAGARALARARSARWSVDSADAAIAAGNVAALEQAAQAGWHPHLAGSVFAAAMSEFTGTSMAWLLDRFPLDALIDSAMSARSGSHGSRPWSVGAMLAAEDFQAGSIGLAKWSSACAQAENAAVYFAKTLGSNPIWEPDAAGPTRQALDVLNVVLAAGTESKSPAALETCVRFVASRAKPVLQAAQEGEAVQAWRHRVAALACETIDAGGSIAPFAPLLELLPRECLAMDANPIVIERGAGTSKSGNLANWARFWMPRSRGSRPVAPGEALRCVGVAALLGPSMPSFVEAFERGWIGMAVASGPFGCENPSFVAWDSARIDAEKGVHVNIESRWIKCVDALNRSAMPSARRAELLAQCESRDPTLWSPGDPRGFSFARESLASPMALLMATLPWSGSQETMVSAKAELLSRAGFSMSEALGVGVLAKDAAQAAVGKPWVARILEREAIASTLR